MTTLKLIGHELWGMFVGDNKLAIYVLVVVALAAASAFILQAGGAVTGAILVLGCTAVLVESVLRAGRG